MCWFKNKKNYSITEKQNSLVVYKALPKGELKLNYNLTVPENHVCFIFTKEKLADSFNAGEVKLYALTMPIASNFNNLEKPTKKGYKKKIKADLLFVSLKDFSLNNKFKLKKDKDKIVINYTLNYKIKDAKKLLEFLLDERAFFKNDYAEKQLNFYISYLLYHYYYDNDYDVEKFKNFIINKLMKCGVETLNLELEREILGEPQKEIFNNYKKDDRSVLKDVQSDTKSSVLDDKIEMIETNNINNINGVEKENKVEFNDVSSNETNFELNGEPSKKKVEYFTCTCGAILPSSAKFCFRCKRNFENEDKMLCENCGCEIKENDHVCPNCHSVLFH